MNYTTVHLASGSHKTRVELRRFSRDPNLRLAIVNEASVVNPEVATLAKNADAVVVVVGFDPMSESEGSDRTFPLPPGQDALIQATLASNKNVVVVITSGGGIDMNAWLDRVPAVL